MHVACRKATSAVRTNRVRAHFAGLLTAGLGPAHSLITIFVSKGERPHSAVDEVNRRRRGFGLYFLLANAARAAHPEGVAPIIWVEVNEGEFLPAQNDLVSFKLGAR